MAGLAALGGWVDAIAAATQLDARAEYALRLCLEEAAVNVVMHGEQEPGDEGAVTLRVEAAADAVRLIVEDRCAAFDPLQVAPPEMPTRLEDTRVGGLGVHLIRQYTKAAAYRRIGGTNRLTLTIARGV